MIRARQIEAVKRYRPRNTQLIYHRRAPSRRMLRPKRAHSTEEKPPSTGTRRAVQCVILAGGLATRMRPLTEKVPKALLSVAGRPFIDHQLEWLVRHDVARVVLSIGYRGELLREHVGDGARFGLAVTYVDEGADLRGTAGALRLALAHDALEEAFLVTYGDSFLPVDFGAVWERFRASGQPALMTVFHNEGRWDTSNVIYAPGAHGDEAGRVVLYDKHRRTRPAADFAYIDYGLSALERRLVEAEVPATGKADLAELFHALSVRGALAGLEMRERFHEIGSSEGLAELETWIAARR
jgi:NDP-sugar pyrophosphorylase family protein